MAQSPSVEAKAGDIIMATNEVTSASQTVVAVAQRIATFLVIDPERSEKGPLDEVPGENSPFGHVASRLRTMSGNMHETCHLLEEIEKVLRARLQLP